MALTTPSAHFSAALAAHRAGDTKAAAQEYMAALAEAPHHRSSWTNLGAILKAERRFDAAIAAHRRALSVTPEGAGARDRTMAEAFAAGAWVDALVLMGPGRPDVAAAALNLAQTLWDAGDFAQALPLFDALTAACPSLESRVGQLACRRALGRAEEALELAATFPPPLPPKLTLERGWARLALGDWAGFEDLEARFDAGYAYAPSLPLPQLTSPAKPGDRLCVFPDQGLGDTIWALRFLPALKARGAEVTMALPPPLLRAFQEVPGADQVIAIDRVKGQFHAAVFTSSLPRAAGFEPGDQPPRAVAARASGATRRDLAARLKPYAGLRRVGICWTGSLTYPANHRRSVTPQHFLPLAADPGVQLFSLYKGPDTALEGLGGLIVDLCQTDKDLADAAAAVDAMDLVISTDTSLLHMAGGLGMPTWALLSAEGFWYWGQGGTSPWYPDMRLFRQPTQGDWDSVFAEVGTALRTLPCTS